MIVTLHVVDGELAGRRFLLRAGEIARIGSSDWADFRVPGDPSIADEHFELQSTNRGCWVRSLIESAPVEVDGQPAARARLRDGMKLIAGRTTFTVAIEGDVAADRTDEQAVVAAAADSPQSPAESRPTAKTIAEPVELSDDAEALLTDEILPEPFFASLRERELLEDAVKFLAAWLPPREAIWWTALCQRQLGTEKMTAAQQTAFEAVAAWLADPADENRQRAKQAAEDAKHDGAASWLAAAVGWTGGSLAPPHQPPVPPPVELVHQAVATALVLAATENGLDDAPARYQLFLRVGDQVRSGECLPPVIKPKG